MWQKAASRDIVTVAPSNSTRALYVLTLSHLSSQKLASENLQGATLMKSPCVFNLPTRAKKDTWCSLLIMSPHIYRCSAMIPCLLPKARNVQKALMPGRQAYHTRDVGGLDFE